MARLQRVEFWGTKQFSAFGFQSEGQGPTTEVQNRLAILRFFSFTQPFVQFRGFGQFSGTAVVGGGEQFLIGGPNLTELFVTGGHISSMGVSYTINPLSKRTV
jgi:hypothetical protein